MSFDKIFDLTAGVCFNCYNISRHIVSVQNESTGRGLCRAHYRQTRQEGLRPLRTTTYHIGMTIH